MKNLLVALLLAGSVPLVAAPPGWHVDFTRAQVFARKSQKPLPLNFAGSDWCIWCQRMKADTLGHKEFVAYASTNLLLVKLDFPNTNPLTKELQAANEALKQRYHAEGFPTFVRVDAEGTELGRQTGYLKGGGPAFTKVLDARRAKAPPAPASP